MKPSSRRRNVLFWLAGLIFVGASAGIFWWQEREISRQRYAHSMAEQKAAGLRQELEALRNDSSSLASRLEESTKKIEQLDLIQRSKSWPIRLVDTFSKADSPDWPTGDYSDSFLDGKRSLSFGEYVWSGSSHTGVYWISARSIGRFSNFYLTIEARKASGPADAYCTLLFRKNGENYYSFQLSDTSYSLWRKTEAELIPLRDWTFFPAIRSRKKNRISVISQGSHLIFMINDQIVDEVDDDALTSGEVDFGIGLMRANESVSFAFDSFEVRSTS